MMMMMMMMRRKFIRRRGDGWLAGDVVNLLLCTMYGGCCRRLNSDSQSLCSCDTVDLN